MLQDKWIITKKTPVKNSSGFLYTMILVDSYEEGLMHTTKFSYKQLHLGSYTDSDLNPLEKQYNIAKADVAVVTMAHISTKAKDVGMKKINCFGKRFDDFDTMFYADQAPFKVERGQTILLRERTRYSDNVDEFDKHCGGFAEYDLLQNTTTGKMSREHAERRGKKAGGSCDNVLVLGINTYALTSGGNVFSKNLLTHGQKFGTIMFNAIFDTIPFYTEYGDTVLIEKSTNANTNETNYEILRNLTVDKMRTEFILKQK